MSVSHSIAGMVIIFDPGSPLRPLSAEPTAQQSVSERGDGIIRGGMPVCRLNLPRGQCQAYCVCFLSRCACPIGVALACGEHVRDTPYDKDVRDTAVRPVDWSVGGAALIDDVVGLESQLLPHSIMGAFCGRGRRVALSK